MRGGRYVPTTRPHPRRGTPHDRTPDRPSRAVLLVMDYQHGIVDMLGEPDELLARAEDAIATARRAARRSATSASPSSDADLRGDSAHEPDGRTRRASAERVSQRLSGRPRYTTGSRRDGDIIVRKVRVGAFSTTDLDAPASRARRRHPVLAGISTSGVVLSTVRDAQRPRLPRARPVRRHRRPRARCPRVPDRADLPPPGRRDHGRRTRGPAFQWRLTRNSPGRAGRVTR